MTLPQSVAAIVQEHVTLELESIELLYLNGSVPQVQRVVGVVGFFRGHRGQPIASAAPMDAAAHLRQGAAQG